MTPQSLAQMSDPRFARFSTTWCVNPSVARSQFAATVQMVVDSILSRTNAPAHLRVIYEEEPTVVGDVTTGYRVEGVFGVVNDTDIN